MATPSRGLRPATAEGTAREPHACAEWYPTISAQSSLIQARVLAFIALARRGVEFDDLRHAGEFAAEGDHELSSALAELRRDGRIALRLAPVRYRLGEKYLRREVPVYYLAPSPERGQA